MSSCKAAFNIYIFFFTQIWKSRCCAFTGSLYWSFERIKYLFHSESSNIYLSSLRCFIAHLEFNVPFLSLSGELWMKASRHLRKSLENQCKTFLLRNPSDQREPEAEQVQNKWAQMISLSKCVIRTFMFLVQILI